MTLAELARHLKVAEKTVQRMLRRGELPAVKVASQWRFMRGAIDEWLMSGMRTADSGALDELLPRDVVPLPLSRLVPAGGVLTGLQEAPKAKLLARLVAPLAEAGVVADAAGCLAQILERERMVSTAVGGGLALPHARDPVAVAGRSGLAIGVSAAGLDYAAPDGLPVHILVLVCADTVARHLEIMAQVALALRDEAVRRSLRRARTPREVQAALIGYEQRARFGATRPRA